MKPKAKAIAKSTLIVVLIFLVMAMMFQINQLQGTARVINYAGLVRGATQREVKLEITRNPNDELITYLDDILSGLKYEDGHYDLISLNDKDYQKKLDVQIAYWHKLKDEIEEVRTQNYQNTDIVEMSETYFQLADETVAAAETYSEKIACNIRWLEILSAIDMIGLIATIIDQTIMALKISKTNKQLEQKAYIDLHTGLPNKSKCEELFHNMEFIKVPTACIVFDMNNLKHVNDSLGHSIGDQLILNFARLLRTSIPSKDFVGRYGGDEFVAVIYDTNRENIAAILDELRSETEKFNSYGTHIKISYSHGWALSTDYNECTLRTLFDKADKYMYENKQQSKLGRQD